MSWSRSSNVVGAGGRAQIEVIKTLDKMELHSYNKV